MKHAHVQDRLDSYLEGDLPLQQRALLDAHLDGCGRCAEELQELRDTIQLLRALPDVEPPPGLADRVLARVDAGEAQPTLRVRAADLLDVLLRPGLCAPVAAAAIGVGVLAFVEPSWFAQPERSPEPARDAMAAQGEGVAPFSGSLVFPRVGLPGDSLAHLGAEAASEEWPRSSTEGGRSPVAVELGGMDVQVENALRDPNRFVDEVSRMPLSERAAWLARVAEEANRAGVAAQVVRTLRTTGDNRADEIIAEFERTATTTSGP